MRRIVLSRSLLLTDLRLDHTRPASFLKGDLRNKKLMDHPLIFGLIRYRLPKFLCLRGGSLRDYAIKGPIRKDRYGQFAWLADAE